MREAAGSARIFRFGVFEADADTGELRKQGIRIRLQDQPFQLLLMLLDRSGELVSRDEIRGKLWPPDTFVDFEQGIGTALKKLRQALSDDAETPRYIETIPKRGYRFIAPVEKPSVPTLRTTHTYEVLPLPANESGIDLVSDSPPSILTITPQRPKLHWTKALAVAGVAVALLIGGIEVARRESGIRGGSAASADVRVVAPASETRPLTTLPGGEYEPALSPDGDMIAFVWGRSESFHIYRQIIDEGRPVRLTTGFTAESSPTWSPDGRYLAFVTTSGGPRASGLYIIPAFGGTARKIATIAPRGHVFDRQIDWSPDGNSLAVVDRNSEGEPFSLYLLSLNSGVKHRLTVPPAATIGDTGPAFSPDGRLIAFRRTESVGCNDIFIVGVSGGQPRRLTFDRRFTSGETWTQNGRDIIFASKRSGSEALWRVKASGGAPTLLSGATQDAYNVAISRTGNRLVYSRYVSNSNIWQMDTASGNTIRLLGSTRNDRSPQYSPDGTRIAFRSDRTGTDEIWISDALGENAFRLTFFNGPLTGTPRWSPDGQFIAFDSRPHGNPDIYVVSANGGPPRRLTSGTSEDVVPSWSNDGRSIYFASNRSGTWQVWKVASDTTAEQNPAKQLTHGGGFAAFESLNGRTVFYAKGSDVPGLWSIPAQGGEERPVTDLLQAGYWGDWGVAQDGVFFVRPLPPGKAEVDKYDFASRHIARVALLEKDLPFSDSGFAVSRDGRNILYSQVDNSTSDLMLVENFH